MPPRPPRIREVLPFIGIPFFLFVLLILLDFPYIVYLLLYHPEHVVAYEIAVNGIWFSPGLLLSFGTLVILLGGMSARAYLKQRRQWREFQEQHVRSEIADRIEIKHPLELPPPAALEFQPFQSIRVREGSFGRGFAVFPVVWAFLAAFLYLAWVQMFFRWPPNLRLDHVILSSAIGIYVIGILFYLVRGMRSQQTLADESGLTLQRDGKTQRISWTEVRQLVLFPLQQVREVQQLDERYAIVTEKGIFELAVYDQGDNTNRRRDIRLLIALVMHHTRLPLMTEQEALRERNNLLNPQALEQNLVTNSALRIFAGVIISSVVIILFLGLHPNKSYHAVAGSLAHYSLARDTATVQLQGDSTTYSLSTDGEYPYPPHVLPFGAAVAMQVDGSNIGQLDVTTPSAQWHFISQSYAEPWYGWYSLSVLSLCFLIPGANSIFSGVAFFWKRAHTSSMITVVTINSLDLFPEWQAPLPSADIRPLSMAELRRYASKQGPWWGTEPKFLRFGAWAAVVFVLYILTGIILLLAFSPQTDLLSSISIEGGIALGSMLLLLWGITLIPKARILQQKNQEAPVEIIGTLLTWTPYQGLYSGFQETLAQISGDDRETYVFRLPRKFLPLARKKDARVRVIFQPETGYVSSLTRA